MIRVLTFGRFADNDFGGLERYVFGLAYGLRDKVHFTNVVAHRGPPPDVPMAGDTVYAGPIARLGNTPICPSMVWHARRLHRHKPFDIVHLQFPADPMAHAAMSMLPRSVKRVITWHSDIVRQKFLLRLYQPFLDRLLRSADAIILPTPAHLSSSRQLDVVRASGKFSVVPFGFDFSRFRNRPPGADAIRARHEGQFLIFALGRHVYYKGFENLIRALPGVDAIDVVLGGRGPLTDDLKRLTANLGLERRVEFTGRIPDEELPAYYHACDVFCMPSVERSEAFGIVQVEAMACGRPVVCCELNNGVTWVNRNEETGLVVPPADPAALAAALVRLKQNSVLRARLGEQARSRAVAEFTAEAMARRTLDVYLSVLGRPR